MPPDVNKDSFEACVATAKDWLEFLSSNGSIENSQAETCIELLEKTETASDGNQCKGVIRVTKSKTESIASESDVTQTVEMYVIETLERAELFL